jgi:hypothetical protein
MKSEYVDIMNIIINIIIIYYDYPILLIQIIYIINLTIY